MASDGLTSFVQQHAGIAAALLSVCGTTAAGFVMRKIAKWSKTLDEIKGNHLVHIEQNTAETKNAVLALTKSIDNHNAQLDVLISVIEKKL